MAPQLFPEGNVIKELESVVDTDAWLLQRMPGAFAEAFSEASYPIVRHRNACQIATSVLRSVRDPLTDVPHDDDFGHLLVAEDIKRMNISDDTREHSRFFGKSSGAMLVHTAIELKNEFTGGNDDDMRRRILGSIREEFWILRPWERDVDVVPKASFVFPEDGLMTALVDLYFTKVNLILPLLHRPSFERSITEGLHLQDDGFGANVLLVCAVASRFSDDPRVFLDGTDSLHSAGWKWYLQVKQIRKSLLAPPTLYDLQFYCLSVMFLQGSSAPQSCWALVGMGIRLAQDVGAHRRNNGKSTITMEEELWKRGFWVLISMDRMISSALGRPCAIQDEDFDVDFPIECDDEYWENSDPSKRFKQPPNKPSYITGFVLLIKLNQVLTIILRTVYSINKSKIKLGFVGPQWEQHIVSELDSALNHWVDAVPDHRALLSLFWMMISLIHIVDVHRRRGVIGVPQIQFAIFTAGIVLLLNIWGGKRAGLSTDPIKEMADVHKCMQALRKCEVRWHPTGRLSDIMYQLASVGELPLPDPSPPPSNKRDRDAEDSPASSSAHASDSPGFTASEPRTIAGSRRVQSHAQLHPSQVDQQTPLPLPLYSNELGRSPMDQPPLSLQVRKQSAPSQQGLMSTFWDIPINPSGGANPSTSAHSQSNPSAGGFPFSEDFYNQMGLGFDGSFVQSTTPAPTQASYVAGNAGGTVPVQPQSMVAGNGVYGGAGALNPLLDSDTVAMWSNAPTGFELDDWGTYLTNVSELTHGMYHPPAGGS
ncbi:hypothetical protein DXG03_006930 [Asterophora parasitica]|uniref:Xylanolytic transcriptional activator regulatory domain-containing protein n=1 Tax=Asterophora parasitica TaxID=117018 RepID=A0A9P7KAY5_9AGAR|nr:hypothetical protein DXG03_006930 [Asterophora parasitica]